MCVTVVVVLGLIFAVTMAAGFVTMVVPEVPVPMPMVVTVVVRMGSTHIRENEIVLALGVGVGPMRQGLMEMSI